MRLMDLLAEGGHDVVKVLADAAYDDRDNWNAMRERGIDFKANIKKSCTGKFKGCSARGLLALRRGEIGEQAWKLEIGYGRRWKVECTFSDLKRLFGFMLNARLKKWMAFEVYWRIRAHNVYKGMLMELREEKTC
jgi:transposase